MKKQLIFVLLCIVITYGFTGCNAFQDAIGVAAPKSDDIVGVYKINHLEHGVGVIVNYPGKYSYRNGKSEAVATTMDMQLQIIKYTNEKVGIGLPTEFEFGNTPNFSTDPKTFKTVDLRYEANKTILLENGNEIGQISTKTLTLEYLKDNSKFLVTGLKQ
jgi:hypothetical protein